MNSQNIYGQSFGIILHKHAIAKRCIIAAAHKEYFKVLPVMDFGSKLFLPTEHTIYLRTNVYHAQFGMERHSPHLVWKVTHRIPWYSFRQYVGNEKFTKIPTNSYRTQLKSEWHWMKSHYVDLSSVTNVLSRIELWWNQGTHLIPRGTGSVIINRWQLRHCVW